jgi:hypothetical protein
MSDRRISETYRDAADSETREPLHEVYGQAGEVEASSAESMQQGREVGVHPIVVKIAIGAALWFLAVVWLAFAGKGGVKLDLVIVVLFFAIFFTLFLLVASYSAKDPRWPARKTSLREFLRSEVRIGDERMRGRDVLIETALVPVTLAFAATLIGLAWVIFG